MTPAAIIQQAMADGVTLALSSVGTIKATGDQQALTHWLPIIREHKPEILAGLQEAANDTPMTTAEETAIRAWLAHINETDQEIIADVLHQCHTDLEARAYFLRRAAEDLRPTDTLCIHGETVAGVQVATEHPHRRLVFPDDDDWRKASR